jgi:hypothetical protein
LNAGCRVTASPRIEVRQEVDHIAAALREEHVDLGRGGGIMPRPSTAACDDIRAGRDVVERVAPSAPAPGGGSTVTILIVVVIVAVVLVIVVVAVVVAIVPSSSSSSPSPFPEDSALAEVAAGRMERPGCLLAFAMTPSWLVPFRPGR